MIVINDLHIGALRSAGATVSSAVSLRQFQLDTLKGILDEVDEELTILGDLFDTYNIPASDILATYQLLTAWLVKGHKLNLVPGNHDLSKDSGKLSSFEFMSKLLLAYPSVTYIKGGGWVNEAEGVYAISHVDNQDLFDMELIKVPECRYLLLHANYNNGFAVNSDHSLNVSQAQAESAKCEKLVFAHEHYHREALGGKVFVCGNQMPASVSDCLDYKSKSMTRLGAGIDRIKTWDASNYVELDWRNPEPSQAQFIRFVGRCKAEESADMADTIARYRRSSEAFVVANAVKVGEDTEGNELALDSLEAISKFNVMEALRDHLAPEEFKVLENLE